MILNYPFKLAPMTTMEELANALERAVQKIERNETTAQQSRDFLYRAGILTKKGNLTSHYQSLDSRPKKNLPTSTR